MLGLHLGVLVPREELARAQTSRAYSLTSVTCSRLRNSRVHWIEKARTWKKGRKLRRGRAAEEGRKKKFLQSPYPFLFPAFFSRPANFSRAFHFCVFPTIWKSGTGFHKRVCWHAAMILFHSRKGVFQGQWAAMLQTNLNWNASAYNLIYGFAKKANEMSSRIYAAITLRARGAVSRCPYHAIDKPLVVYM